MKRSSIRGVKIVREPYVPSNRVEENLKYTIEVYDERDNFLERLGRLHDLDAAIAAFKACCAKYPQKLICVKDRARVVRSSDRPEG